MVSFRTAASTVTVLLLMVGGSTSQVRDVESTLEIIDVATGARQVVYRAREHFEAPNWSADGRFLVFNRAGSLYRLPTSGGTAERIETGSANRLNNDHGFSGSCRSGAARPGCSPGSSADRARSTCRRGRRTARGSPSSAID